MSLKSILGIYFEYVIVEMITWSRGYENKPVVWNAYCYNDVSLVMLSNMLVSTLTSILTVKGYTRMLFCVHIDWCKIRIKYKPVSPNVPCWAMFIHWLDMKTILTIGDCSAFRKRTSDKNACNRYADFYAWFYKATWFPIR